MATGRLRSTMRWVSLVATALLLMLLAQTPPNAQASQASAPVAVSPSIVEAGGSLTVTLQRGGRFAFLLSADKRSSRGDLLLGVKSVRGTSTKPKGAKGKGAKGKGAKPKGAKGKGAKGQDTKPKGAKGKHSKGTPVKGKSKGKQSKAKQSKTTSKGIQVRLKVPKRASPMAAYLLICRRPAKRGSACSASPTQIAVVRKPSPAHAHPLPSGAPGVALVGPAGGSVSTAAGSSLSIPEGALPGTVSVSLTPIASLGGGLQGHLTGVVQTGPANTALARLGTLSVPATATTGVIFEGGGANLHLAPLGNGGIAISSLGGGGGGIASPAAKLIAFARRHVAADPLSELEQLLAVVGLSAGSGKGAGKGTGPGGGGGKHSRGKALAHPLLGKRSRGKARIARRNGGGEAGFDPEEAELNAYLTAGAYQVEAIANADLKLGVAQYQLWYGLAEGAAGFHPSILAALNAEVKAALLQAGLQQVAKDEDRCSFDHELYLRGHMLELEAVSMQLPELQPIATAVQKAIAHCFQFDLEIDSSLEHNDRASGFEGAFHWHYEAKAPLDYDAVATSPSDLNISITGTNGGKFVTAEGSEVEPDAGECSENETTVEGISKVLQGNGGDVKASAQFLVPVAAEQLPTISLTFSSTASETYAFEVKDESDSKCNGSAEREIQLWWEDAWLSLTAWGATSESPGGPLTLEIQPPEQSATAAPPPPELMGEVTIPAESEGYSGTTTLKLIHDPGHVILPSLPPAS